MRGVEFHRQRDELKNRGQGKQHDSKQKQRLNIQNHTQQQQNERKLGAKLRCGNDRCPQLHRAVPHGVLYSVSRLVSRHTHCRDGSGIINVLRQGNTVIPRVIMIRQASGAWPDRNIVNPMRPQNRLRCLRACEVPFIGDCAVALEIAADLRLCPNGQKQNGNQQNTVDIVR